MSALARLRNLSVGMFTRHAASTSGGTPVDATPVGGPDAAPATDPHGPRNVRRRGRRGRGEQLMVPEAEFTSYYGRPIIKPPVWKVPDVPAYLYLGGMAGVNALLAELGAVTGRPALRRVGRLASAGGAVVSVVFLIHDLGRPERFLNMMRVIKPTSPLSVGSWILAPFGALSGATAASEVTGLLPGVARFTGAGAGLLGPALTTYTAVLFSDTAVPAWHDAHRELPYLFAASALASGGGVGLLAGLSGDDVRPARRVAVAGAVAELVASEVLERRIGYAAHAYRTGRAGTVLRAARAGTAVGGLAAAASGFLRGRRGRIVGALGGLLLNASSAATRYGVFEAGMESARDPAYTVVPQRARLEEKARLEGPES